MTVRYTVTPARPEAHLFIVACAVDSPDPDGQAFRLPAWIPGSYMIREFARHIVRIRASCRGRPVALAKEDKHTWRAAPCRGPLTVEYEVYAWDLSVRCAHLDATHGFFNGTQLFLAAAGHEQGEHLVDLRPPRHADWRVATTLPEARGRPGAAKRHGFGLYRAADYDTLIDHPVEMGRFQSVRFTACGVPHEVAITGGVRVDTRRLAADLQRVCEWQIRFFGEPAPFRRYLFLVMAVGEGYGGLEHRDSTALICSRRDLPAPGMKAAHEAYATFLGLCSHEYFHAWNVKRIKPAAFIPYDLAQENYTRLLWLFEGFTSYYDDLALRRCGLLSPAAYLERLGKTLAAVQRGSGRLKQSVAESSFDAWIKYYRQDENAPNALVSYYAKGALIALALDLTLRRRTGGAVSLDDVMRALWARHGDGRGLGEDEFAGLVRDVSGLDLRRFLDRAVQGTGDLPLKPLLAAFGLNLRWESASPLPSLGAKTAAEAGSLVVKQVFDEGPAQQAGLSAGDTLLALDGLRLTERNLDTLFGRHRAGDELTVHFFRHDELRQTTLRLAPPAKDICRLTLVAKSAPAARRLRDGWLGGPLRG